MKAIISVILIFILAACAGPMPKPENFIQSTDIPTLDSEKSYVYFYRPARFMGAGTSYFIYDDDELIGALRNGGYFVYEAVAGDHFFWAETEMTSSVILNCESGKTYYVEGGAKMGSLRPNPELNFMPESVGKKRMIGLQYYTFDFTARSNQ